MTLIRYPKCVLRFKVAGGKAEVLELKVKTREPHD